MAKNDDIGGVWRTVGGRRIFIKDGQDLETAMKESGKFENKNANKKEQFDKLSEYDKRELYNKLSDEEKTKYDNLKKEIRQAYRDNDQELVNKLKEERTKILMDKMEDKPEKPKTSSKQEEKSKTESKYKEWGSEEKEKLLENIDYYINDLGEDGRIDGNKSFKIEELNSNVWNEMEKVLGRELEDEDLDFIDGQLGAFYRDGFYVAKDSFSLKEYSDKVNNTLFEVDDMLERAGFSVHASRSIYAGLVPSRYYTKGDITVRIGDHTNSNNMAPSHTRRELFNSTAEDLVKYVKSRYKQLK